MAVKPPYPHAGFLDQLTQASESGTPLDAPSASPALADILFASGNPTTLTQAGNDLIPLLITHEGTLLAAYNTALVADDLRRYQKFAKPGQPSPHIVQLRKQQAAVRQASSLSKQQFIKAAATFVRAAGIAVPEKVALERYIIRWININVPKAAAS